VLTSFGKGCIRLSGHSSSTIHSMEDMLPVETSMTHWAVFERLLRSLRRRKTSAYDEAQNKLGGGQSRYHGVYWTHSVISMSRYA
jgi:hypothetical protein